MQSDLMHELVHDERGSRHISRIFQKRDEHIEYQYVRKEDQHAADASDDTVDDKILKPSCAHGRCDKGAYLLHQPFYPLHRILTEQECTLENQVKQEEEYRESQPFVGDERIDLVRKCISALLPLIRFICLGQSTLHESVFRIYQS